MESSSVSNDITTLFLPPGLSLSHLPARLALSTPSILRLILIQLTSPERTSIEELRHTPAHYVPLRTVSLVAKPWAQVAREELHRDVVFTRGDEQMRRWLSAVECARRKGEKLRINGAAFLGGRVSESGEKEEGNDLVVWSAEVMQEVLAMSVGTRSLTFMLPKLRNLPAEALAGTALKDLTSLSTTCPLTVFDLNASLPRLPFKLHRFGPLSTTDTRSPADWAQTFFLLSPSFSTLQALNLSRFLIRPCEAHFFPSLMPATQTLTTLTLPPLTLTPSTYRLALFVASGLPALASLSLSTAHPSFIREVLPYFARFAPALQRLTFLDFHVPIGAGFASSALLDFPDPVEPLEAVLHKWSTRKEGGQLEVVRLEGVQIKEMSLPHLNKRVGEAAKRVGAELQVEFDERYDRQFKGEEIRRIGCLFHQSLNHLNRLDKLMTDLEAKKSALYDREAARTGRGGR